MCCITNTVDGKRNRAEGEPATEWEQNGDRYLGYFVS
jgi:hypothetical protein